MEKNDNIFVKLQIEKDNQSGGLTLGIYFDKTAPNFTIEKEGMNWSPTSEELDFIIETFEMVSNKKGQFHNQSNTHKNFSTNYSSHKEKYEPPVVKSELNRVEVEPITPHNHVTENPTPPEKSEERIFVQANEATIDEALKRKKAEQTNQFPTDSDEKFVIDKVLKDKIKQKK